MEELPGEAADCGLIKLRMWYRMIKSNNTYCRRGFVIKSASVFWRSPTDALIIMLPFGPTSA